MNSNNNRYDRLLWGATIFLVLIGIGAVVHRLLFLHSLPSSGNYVPSVDSRSPIPDTGFAEHPLLTFIHIVPGLLFMLLAPLQFVKRIRNGYPAFHRLNGYIILTCGLVIGTTALIMGFTMAIGGITETLAVAVYGIWFLFCLMKAYTHILKREIALHREWMIRFVAIGLSVSTTRPIVVMFFLTSGLTGLNIHQYFGIAFWISFTLHLVAAELWIRETRERPANAEPPIKKAVPNTRDDLQPLL